MKPTIKHILFTHYGDQWIRGSERCLLDLLQHLDTNKFTATVWCNTQLFADEVRKLDIKVYVSDFPVLFGWSTDKSNLTGFYTLIKKGIKIVKDENIDLIHANSGVPNQCLNIVARFNHIPLLSHLHSRYPLRDRLTLGLFNSSLVVGVSHPVVNQLLDDGLDKSRVEVIPNGIDTNNHDQAKAVNLRELLNLNDDDFITITVASLIHRKGIDLTIRALSILHLNDIPVHLVILGDGPDLKILKKLAIALNLTNHIHFMGERKDVASLLRSGANLFVSAAREEVFGLVLTEAMLASLPVIATNVGGVSEVIDDGTNGLLVKAENSLSIAAAIDLMYHRPSLAKKLGQSARQHVLDNFTIQENVRRFETTYLRLINNTDWHLNFFKYSSFKVVAYAIYRCLRIYCTGKLHKASHHQSTI